ncbi:transketolase [Gracilibacillus orientalis]|uniref:Transketolase n=1 Tax=Gracilibacillus orientalis TaxID=334253 RepID=A0A1I4HS59_9BACI|nr:transketolase family protein [Gracilibacillus orientalis]SFL44401.1 transketolase [Gracilibacillus orientalis]
MTKAKSGRDGFGKALLELGEKNQNVVALCADLAESVRVEAFANKYPERYFQIGISEQDMIGTASGLALSNYIPFATTYAVFAAQRANEQIRLAACYNQANVKIAVSHAGLTCGEDGATHQALEDIASMRVMPEMTVIVPADENEAYEATKASVEWIGPIYLRLGRTPVPIVTNDTSPFQIGKARTLKNGTDVSIFACGIMVERALQAREQLASEGINASVINIHTIKPLDKETIINEVQHTDCVVTAEEHSIIGGLGGAISELLAEEHPVPVHKVGTQDTFGESASPEELLEKYGLTAAKIVTACKEALGQKEQNLKRVRS